MDWRKRKVEGRSEKSGGKGNCAQDIFCEWKNPFSTIIMFQKC